MLLIEKNSHFQHLFAFPRFAVATDGINTHKAFIPYKPGVFMNAPAGSGDVVQAAVVGLTKTDVRLDRKVLFGDRHQDHIPFSYLVSKHGARKARSDS